MAKKPSFTKGTAARKARGKIAEDLKTGGASTDSAFAQATAITKRASRKGRKTLATKGLKA